MWINLNAGTGNMEMTSDPAGVNNIELVPKEAIAGVSPVTLQTKPAPPDDWAWQHPYPTMTVVGIVLKGPYNRTITLELQEVTNKAGWSTGTQAGINQCVADFSAFL